MQRSGMFDCPTEERLSDTLVLIDKSYYTNGKKLLDADQSNKSINLSFQLKDS